jgi:hypothetical protein
MVAPLDSVVLVQRAVKERAVVLEFTINLARAELRLLQAALQVVHRVLAVVMVALVGLLPQAITVTAPVILQLVLQQVVLLQLVPAEAEVAVTLCMGLVGTVVTA